MSKRYVSASRLGILGAFSMTMAMAMTASSQVPQTPFVSRSDLVVVPAVVVDGRGQPILDLTQDDFEVREDGKPAALAAFVAPDSATATDGRFIVIVLDNLRIDPARVWKVKEMAKKFADLMGPKDVLGVIKLNGGQGVTSSRKSEVMAAIDRFAPSPLAGENMASTARENDEGLETLADLTNQLAKAPHRRKVMVVIGSARLFSPMLPGGAVARSGAAPPSVGEFSASWVQAIRDSGRNNVSIYVLDPSGLTGGGGQYDGARSFASETGGDALVNTNNVDRAVSRIWMEAGTYYLLGYEPPIDDKRLHRIEVTVKRAGAQVRARKARG